MFVHESRTAVEGVHIAERVAHHAGDAAANDVPIPAGALNVLVHVAWAGGIEGIDVASGVAHHAGDAAADDAPIPTRVENVLVNQARARVEAKHVAKSVGGETRDAAANDIPVPAGARDMLVHVTGAGGVEAVDIARHVADKAGDAAPHLHPTSVDKLVNDAGGRHQPEDVPAGILDLGAEREVIAAECWGGGCRIAPNRGLIDLGLRRVPRSIGNNERVVGPGPVRLHQNVIETVAIVRLAGRFRFVVTDLRGTRSQAHGKTRRRENGDPLGVAGGVRHVFRHLMREGEREAVFIVDARPERNHIDRSVVIRSRAVVAAVGFRGTWRGDNHVNGRVGGAGSRNAAAGGRDGGLDFLLNDGHSA